jgi:hypothetical protein
MFAIFDAMNNNQSIIEKSVSLFTRIFSEETKEDQLACEVIVNSYMYSQKKSSANEMNAIENNEIGKASGWLMG